MLQLIIASSLEAEDLRTDDCQPWAAGTPALAMSLIFQGIESTGRKYKNGCNYVSMDDTIMYQACICSQSRISNKSSNVCPQFQALRQQHAEVFQDSHDAVRCLMRHKD